VRFNSEPKRCKSVSLSAKRSVFTLVGLAHGVVTEKLRFPYYGFPWPPPGFGLWSVIVPEHVTTCKPQRRIYASDRRSDRRSSYGLYAVIILCFCFWRYGQLPVSRRSSAVGVAIPVTRSRSRSCHRDGGPGIITDLTRHGDFNLPVTRTLKLTRPAGRTR